MYNKLIDACRTDYLLNVLKSDDPSIQADGFKADIHKKWNEKSEEQKRKELVSYILQPTRAHCILSYHRQ